MRMVGIQDDMAHLREPAVVQSFLDDCDELRDTLQDSSDYAQAGQTGSNKIAMLHLSADKVLAELQRTRDTDHLRARHIVRLADDWRRSPRRRARGKTWARRSAISWTTVSVCCGP